MSFQSKKKIHLKYKSKSKGVMHACGHDGIAAVVLGLANLLKVNQAKLN